MIATPDDAGMPEQLERADGSSFRGGAVSIDGAVSWASLTPWQRIILARMLSVDDEPTLSNAELRALQEEE